MLPDPTEREIADLHAVNHERTRHAKEPRRVVRAQFLILRKDRDAFAPGQMAKQSVQQNRGLRGKDKI